MNFFNIDISTDGSMLATSCNDATFSIYDTRSWDKIHTILVEGNSDRFRQARLNSGLSFSPDNRYLAISDHTSTIQVLDTSNWKVVKRIDTNLSKNYYVLSISSIDFSKDSKKLLTVLGSRASSSDYVARIWDLDEPTSVNTWEMYDPN